MQREVAPHVRPRGAFFSCRVRVHPAPVLLHRVNRMRRWQAVGDRIDEALRTYEVSTSVVRPCCMSVLRWDGEGRILQYGPH